jgi:hypothetical protein
MIVTPEGLNILSSKEAMMHGKVGNYESVDINFDIPDVNITNFNIDVINRKKVKLTWSIKGDILLIDHFIVMREVLGAYDLLGKCHSEFEDNNCYYYHYIEDDDLNTYRYIIVAILNDYTIGEIYTSDFIEN